jgi:hypothetical protein
MRLAIEDMHSGVTEDLGYFAFLSRLIVMISQYGHDRHAHRRKRFGHQPCLFGITAVGKVATERQHVGVFGHLSEQDLEWSVRSLSTEVNVANGGDSNCSVFLGHCNSISF